MSLFERITKSCVQLLTDGGDVRRVKFVVRESAQQTCFPNPRVSEEQESEEHIVLLRHGVDARCDGWINHLTQRGLAGLLPPPASHVCPEDPRNVLTTRNACFCSLVATKKTRDAVAV